MAKISHFYSISPLDLLEMPSILVDELWQNLTIIEAQEQLKSFQAHDWSNLSRGKRESEHKRLHRLAYPNTIQEKKSITVEDLQRLLSNA